MDSPLRRPTVALMPLHLDFDDEAHAAAAAGFAVVRYSFLEHLELTWPSSELTLPCTALWRGFMLSGARFRQFAAELAEQQLLLLSTPEQYERAHYYPNAYPSLSFISPRATWAAVPEGEAVSETLFAEALATVRGWEGCKHVLLKDYVKSPKDHTMRFMKVAVEDLEGMGSELVAARGAAFNKGVVYKEHVELMNVQTRGGIATNEWRLFFAHGKLIGRPHPNSWQPSSADAPPPAMLEQAAQAARALGSPYVSIDLAETQAEQWICLECGDGGVSGPATGQEGDLEGLWTGLKHAFCAETPVEDA